MKPKTTRASRTTKPQLSLRAQVLFRDRQGHINDVTDQNLFWLRGMAEEGALALHILNQCHKRLDLLFLAAEHRSHVEAGLVRLAVDDLRIDLEDGSHLAGYIESTQKFFRNSKALAPRQPSGPRTTSRALSISKSSA